MKIKLSFLLMLGLGSFLSIAQWNPKLTGAGINSIFISKVHYLTKDEAYAAGNSGELYYTNTNWKNFKLITTNLPVSDDIQYIEMTSRTKGTLVTRKANSNGGDSSFIYVTENGGYKWTLVYSLPKPIPSQNWGISFEPMFFKRKDEKLYILFGDLICNGKINSKNWSSKRIAMQRATFNADFQVYGDNLFSFINGSNKWYTNNQGFNWTENLIEPNLYTYNSSLGNSFQRISDWEQNEIRIETYDTKEKQWKLIAARPGAAVIRNSVQLSDNYLLISFTEFSNFNQINHTVFDFKNKEWLDLISTSSFF